MKTQKELTEKLNKEFEGICGSVKLSELEHDMKGAFLLLSTDDTTEGVEAKCSTLMVGTKMSIAKTVLAEMLSSDDFADIIMNVAANYSANKREKNSSLLN